MGDSELLIAVVHTVNRSTARRMVNVSAVLAALRSHFTVARGVHVVPLDVSGVEQKDTLLVAQIFARANVVVTGAGLYNTWHLLLSEAAVVVEVETHGVAWEAIE